MERVVTKYGRMMRLLAMAGAMLAGMVWLSGCSTGDCLPGGVGGAFFCPLKTVDDDTDVRDPNRGELCPESATPGDECAVDQGTQIRCSSVNRCTCGDGVRDLGEECDDGNTEDGDSCSNDCRVVCSSDTECSDALTCYEANTCNTDTQRCEAGEPSAKGTVCGEGAEAGTCDGLGNCLSCALSGTSCRPVNGCADGVFICESGEPICAVRGAKEAGTPCLDDGICDGRAECVTCADAGDACVPSQSSCLKGTIACADGAERPTCEIGDEPEALENFTQCEENGVCLGGQCVSCRSANGQMLPIPGMGCTQGTIACGPNDEPLVELFGSIAPGGVCVGSDGTEGQCNDSGECVCDSSSGAACESMSNDCVDTTLSCPDNADPTCRAVGFKAVGEECGSDDGRCNGRGACLTCPAAAGMSCVDEANPCKVAAIDCSSGVAQCVATDENLPFDTACGNAGFCDGEGTCVECGGAESGCNLASACQVGGTGCSDQNESVCIPRGMKAPGELCYPDQALVCDGEGVCIECDNEGLTCVPPDTTGLDVECYDLESGQVECIMPEPEEAMCRLEPKPVDTPCDNGAGRCDENQTCVPCLPTEGESPELCINGMDDDCDGDIDEEDADCAELICDPSVDTQRGCDTGQPGICADGMQTCQPNGLWADCIALNEPAMENTDALCHDGLDNDCDGDTDVAEDASCACPDGFEYDPSRQACVQSVMKLCPEAGASLRPDGNCVANRNASCPPGLSGPDAQGMCGGPAGANPCPRGGRYNPANNQCEAHINAPIIVIPPNTSTSRISPADCAAVYPPSPGTRSYANCILRWDSSSSTRNRSNRCSKVLHVLARDRTDFISECISSLQGSFVTDPTSPGCGDENYTGLCLVRLGSRVLNVMVEGDHDNGGDDQESYAVSFDGSVYGGYSYPAAVAPSRPATCPTTPGWTQSAGTCSYNAAAVCPSAEFTPSDVVATQCTRLR